MHISSKIGRTQGFTIVELIIVVAVIGILVTIGIVSYGGVQSSAREKTVMSDAEAVSSEVARYGTKNGGVYGSAVAWYSPSGANGNIVFTPSSGNVIDVVANTSEYCVRAWNTAATSNSVSKPVIKESTPGICVGLRASAAAGGAGTDSLIGWWKLNGNAADSSTNGKNGTVLGTLASTTGEDGTANGAYLFDGVGSGRIDIPAGSSLNNSVFTYCAWIKPESLSGDATILGNLGVSGGPQFRFNSNRTLSLLKQNILGVGTSPGPVIAYAPAWTHVCVSYSGTGAYTFYINGATAGSGTNAQTFTYSNFQIGGMYSSAFEPFNGAIDDVRIYDRVVSLEDIARLASLGAL